MTSLIIKIVNNNYFFLDQIVWSMKVSVLTLGIAVGLALSRAINHVSRSSSGPSFCNYLAKLTNGLSSLEQSIGTTDRLTRSPLERNIFSWPALLQDRKSALRLLTQCLLDLGITLKSCSRALVHELQSPVRSACQAVCCKETMFLQVSNEKAQISLCSWKRWISTLFLIFN